MRYANSREVFRSGGRFAKSPSLADLGYEVNDRMRVCAKCGHEWFPVLVTGECPQCGTELTKAEEEGR